MQRKEERSKLRKNSFADSSDGREVLELNSVPFFWIQMYLYVISDVGG